MEDSRVADPVLDSYLSAQQSCESDELGGLLSSRAEPIVRKVVFWRIGDSRADAEDVCAQAILSLMLHLQRYKKEGHAPIQDFDGYAATSAHHACDQYLRRKNPALWRLHNRIRYVLEHDARFALWRSSHGVWLCGLARWKAQPSGGTPPASGDLAGCNHLSMPELISRIFRSSSGPVELNSVVELVQTVTVVPGRSLESSDELELADTRAAVDTEMEQRTYAADAWKQIRELPSRQRHALLFNLRHDAMNLLVLTRVASFRDIAATLEIQPEELASFWNKLPFEDTEIAERLGCTRQQVINLRMAARKRLANRLAGWR
ncbi:MAG TPA: sigma-70 family RNA polymerase sigma factor [Candidatus Sulfotelmatobacter sp.]|nr:sigma-70 family RNA polymerase sigma factor [Candidatus Sulfotelmatobacter sp.]